MASNNINKTGERFDPTINKGDYAETHSHISRYQFAGKYIKETASFQKSEKVLDVACGYGYGSKILHQLTDLKVVGLDSSKEAIDYAKKIYSKKPVISFLKVDTCHLPFPDNSYQYTVCFETIEHLAYQEAILMIKELHRVLKPGGVLVISTPNKIFSLATKAVLGVKNPHHLYEFYPWELEKLLIANRFEIHLRLGQTFIFPLTYLLARIKLLPKSYFFPCRGLLAWLSVNSVFVVKKS